MSHAILWNHDEPVRDLGVDVPAWIEQDVTPSDVAAIVQGGCASGAYMPAVTYSTPLGNVRISPSWALATMAEHGDDVLQHIEDALGELPAPDANESWGGIAVHYLSLAVELWASSVLDNMKRTRALLALLALLTLPACSLRETIRDRNLDACWDYYGELPADMVRELCPAPNLEGR